MLPPTAEGNSSVSDCPSGSRAEALAVQALLFSASSLEPCKM